MKRLIFSPLMLILLSFLFFSMPSFGGNGNDSLYSFEIDGKIFIPKNDPVRSYKITLLCQNQIVDSGTVVDDESFLLRVKKNSLYTVRITKEGYVPMMISIDTSRKEYTQDGHKFTFDGDYFVTLYGFHLNLSLRNLNVVSGDYARK